MHSDAERCHERIRARIGSASVDVGLVLGAGLSAIADQVTQATAIAYAELPGFPSASAGDTRELVIGTLGTAQIAVFRGRTNYNEGGDPAAMRVPLETLAALGAKAVVLVSATGSVRAEISPGMLLTITDHINLSGLNPLVGEPGLTRSVDMANAYDRHLRERFAIAAGQLGRKVHEGVLMWFPGPSFETPAEVRAAQILGADVVATSLVPEAVLARRFGLRLLGLAMVTNYAAGLQAEPVTSELRMRAAAASASSLSRVLGKFFEIWMVESRAARRA